MILSLKEMKSWKLVFLTLFIGIQSALASEVNINSRCVSHERLDSKLCSLITLSPDGNGEDIVYYRYSESTGYQLLRHRVGRGTFAYRTFFSDDGSLIAIGEKRIIQDKSEQKARFHYQIYHTQDFYTPGANLSTVAILDDFYIKDINQFSDDGTVVYDLRMKEDGCLAICPIEIDGPLCVKTIKIDIMKDAVE